MSSARWTIVIDRNETIMTSSMLIYLVHHSKESQRYDVVSSLSAISHCCIDTTPIWIDTFAILTNMCTFKTKAA
jgi:hypothetical protein